MVEWFIVYTCILIFLNLYLIFGWNKKSFAKRIDKNQGMLPSIKKMKQIVEDTVFLYPFIEKLLKEYIEYN